MGWVNAPPPTNPASQNPSAVHTPRPLHTRGSGPEARGERLALAGMMVNILLAIIKLIAGIAGNSYALIADAIESIADIAGSLVIWGGLRIASRPIDSAHPYGYGKAESLAAFLVSLLIFGAGIGIAVEAIREIVTPHHAPAAFTLVVLVVVVITKEVMFRIVRKAARQSGSAAIETDARHHRVDAITSLGAFIGIAIAVVGGPGYEPADDWAALAVSAVILLGAIRLMARPVRELLDANSGEIGDQASRIAASIEGVANVEKSVARKAGMGYWVDMHARVDPTMTVQDAHTLAHRVKDEIREKMPQVKDVLIHIEPA